MGTCQEKVGLYIIRVGGILGAKSVKLPDVSTFICTDSNNNCKNNAWDVLKLFIQFTVHSGIPVFETEQ